jgi:hypothetical protein
MMPPQPQARSKGAQSPSSLSSLGSGKPSISCGVTSGMIAWALTMSWPMRV